MPAQRNSKRPRAESDDLLSDSQSSDMSQDNNPPTRPPARAPLSTGGKKSRGSGAAPKRASLSTGGKTVQIGRTTMRAGNESDESDGDGADGGPEMGAILQIIEQSSKNAKRSNEKAELQAKQRKEDALRRAAEQLEEVTKQVLDEFNAGAAAIEKRYAAECKKAKKAEDDFTQKVSALKAEVARATKSLALGQKKMVDEHEACKNANEHTIANHQKSVDAIVAKANKDIAAALSPALPLDGALHEIQKLNKKLQAELPRGA